MQCYRLAGAVEGIYTGIKRSKRLVAYMDSIGSEATAKICAVIIGAGIVDCNALAGIAGIL